MNVAQHFYARHPRRRETVKPRRRRRASKARPFLFERLEERLLLSSSPGSILPSLVVGAIDGPGEQDRYTFNLPADSKLFFDSQTDNSNIHWSLSGPAGAAVSDRSFTSSDANGGDGVLHLPAGSYTLTVDGVKAATGPYAFRLVDLEAATPFTPGTPVTGALDPANGADAYRFEAQAGDRIFFDVQARSTTSGTRWRLLDPYGVAAFDRDFNGTTSDAGPLTLASAGTYTLLLEGPITGTGTDAYTFTAQPVTDESFGLTLGATVAEAIDEQGEQDVYSFSLAGDARLYLDALTDNTDVMWSLTGPVGTPVSDRRFSASDAPSGDGVLHLPAGSYALTVRGNGATTAPYSFRLLDLAAATPLTPGTPGTPVSGTLDPGNETDAYRFGAAAGDRMFFDVQARSGSNASWRLLDPFGNKVTEFDTSFNSTSSDVGPLTLGFAGTYTLLIEGQGSVATSGSYTFRVDLQGNTPPPEPPASLPLVLGATTTHSISVAGEQDAYSFTLDSPARLYFDSLTGSTLGDTNFRWTLEGPAGVVASNQTFSSADDVIGSPVQGDPRRLLPAGAYTLTVAGVGTATGIYSFRLLDLAAAEPLTPGTAVSGTLAPAN